MDRIAVEDYLARVRADRTHKIDELVAGSAALREDAKSHVPGDTARKRQMDEYEELMRDLATTQSVIAALEAALS